MTTKTSPEVLTNADLETVTGGDKVSYLLSDVKAAYKPTLEIVDSFETVGKRDIGTGGKPLPTEEVTLGYTEVEWTY